LFVCLSVPARARARRAHYLSAASLFGILGFHVGVWAVQLAPPSACLGLHPAALGTAVTVAAASGVITLFAGGALADRVGRRPVLAIGRLRRALAAPVARPACSAAPSGPGHCSSRLRGNVPSNCVGRSGNARSRRGGERTWRL